MKPFHTIAVPHDDIVKKRLTMDVFAADLWDTYRGRGPEEYTDSDTFFRKTHMTANMIEILGGVQKRLAGEGGDGFQHIETPFGGGKTHALIAMYHKAREWGAKCVVIVGTVMGPEDTVWGKIEKQLDGKVEILSGKLAPGRENLERVLERHGPVLILIDELLPYVSMAAGVKVNDTSLATQAITFIQQLSEATSTLDRVCVVASFPASVYDMVDRKAAEELLAKISKVSGRKERKITPVDPNDVPSIIRSRLFSTAEEEIRQKSAETISEFADYCKDESILPPDKTAVQYRKMFEETYPFLPEVISVLYHNWGSFSSFQRTRGVLRLLSQVIYALKDSDRPYISLSDFDLKDDSIRRELLGHIGGEFDSVISKDITDADSGARRADDDAGASHKGLRIGTKSAVAIFMHSFKSGGGDNSGATVDEVKRAACIQGVHSSIVGDVIGNFKSKMSYIKSEDSRYLFTSEPNINRLKMDKMDSIGVAELEDGEKSILIANVGPQRINTRVWPSGPSDIDDSPSLKLAVMSEENVEKFENTLESKGGAPRIYRNSIIFLCPSESERGQFVELLKSKIALEKILADRSSIKPEQKREVEKDLRSTADSLPRSIRQYYRNLYMPDKGKLKKYDMGIPLVGDSKGITENIFGVLKLQQEVHESIGPLVIQSEYLEEQEYAKTAPIYESMLKLKGSRRPVSRSVIKEAICQGVLQKTFGVGIIVDGTPSCQYFGDEAQVEFSDNEVIIAKTVCEQLAEEVEGGKDKVDEGGITGGTQKPKELGKISSTQNSIVLKFDLPEGKMSDVWGVLSMINSKFRSIHFGTWWK